MKARKKRSEKPIETQETEKEKVMIPAGTTLYCWRFNHPTVGWVGGGPDDHWEESKSAIEGRMKYCPYESELISKVTE
jgi:hypothetical protein